VIKEKREDKREEIEEKRRERSEMEEKRREGKGTKWNAVKEKRTKGKDNMRSEQNRRDEDKIRMEEKRRGRIKKKRRDKKIEKRIAEILKMDSGKLASVEFWFSRS
jgi:hypothetical protein